MKLCQQQPVLPLARLRPAQCLRWASAHPSGSRLSASTCGCSSCWGAGLSTELRSKHVFHAQMAALISPLTLLPGNEECTGKDHLVPTERLFLFLSLSLHFVGLGKTVGSAESGGPALCHSGPAAGSGKAMVSVKEGGLLSPFSPCSRRLEPQCVPSFSPRVCVSSGFSS